MTNKIIAITETDMEYGYNLFVGISESPEKALEICQKLYGASFPLMLNESKSQVLESYNGEPFTTVYFLEELEINSISSSVTR